MMKKRMKRLWAVVCVVALLCGVIPAANLGQVEATDGTVVVEEKLTTGLVVPGSGNDYSKEGYVFGGFFDDYDEDTKQFDNPIMVEKNASEEDPIYIKWVPKAVMNVKAQVRQDEYKKVISNCDDTSKLSTEKTSMYGGVKTDKDIVQEGTGYFERNTSTSSATLYNIYLSDSVDVSGYKYFSCKLYVADVSKLTATNAGYILRIDLCSDDTISYTDANNNVIRFLLKKDALAEYAVDGQEGWYDLKLPLTQAYSFGANCDRTQIEFIQITQPGGKGTVSIKTRLDDICVLNECEGTLIADCDQDNTITKVTPDDYTSITTTLDEKKEGIGAVKATCYPSGSNYRMRATTQFADNYKHNISQYETGSIHLWLYISQEVAMKDDATFTIQLASGGSNANSNRFEWTIAATELHGGWNEIIKPLNDPSETQGTIVWSAVNYIDVWIDGVTEAAYNSENAYMIIDDIRIINRVQVLECDSMSEVTFATTTPTVTQQDVKQGSGAFEVSRAADGAKTIYSMTLPEAIDFSAWMGKNGCLHLWFYVDQVKNIGSTLNIDIDSDSKFGTKMRYSISADYLEDGWNELYINLDGITSTGLDKTKIQYIRIVAGEKGACTTRLDDISLIPGNAETLDVRFVSTVDSLDYQSVGYEITQSRSQTPLQTETKNVYKRIWATNKARVLDSVIPSDVSGVNCSTYMHLVTLVNIPIRLWDATFTVTPWWKTQDGTTVKGDAQTYTMNKLMSITKQSQEDTDFRVIVTSDVHYTDLNGSVNGYNADGRLQLWVNSILQEHEKKSVDLVIVNGDTSLDYRSAGTGGDLLANDRSGTKEFVEKYVSQLRAEGISVVVLPGNHEQYSENDWRELTGNNRNETYVLGSNLFIMLDSYGTNLDPQGDAQKSDGTYSVFDVDYLKKMMSQFPEHNVYIVSHYIDMAQQDSQFLNLLQTNENIVGLFSGHTHSALTLGGEDDTTYGGKTVAQTGHFSWEKDSTSWGFRDLVITADSAECKYISVAENNGTITCTPDDSTMITYYSSEQ